MMAFWLFLEVLGAVFSILLGFRQHLQLPNDHDDCRLPIDSIQGFTRGTYKNHDFGSQWSKYPIVKDSDTYWVLGPSGSAFTHGSASEFDRGKSRICTSSAGADSIADAASESVTETSAPRLEEDWLQLKFKASAKVPGDSFAVPFWL